MMAFILFFIFGSLLSSATLGYTQQMTKPPSIFITGGYLSNGLQTLLKMPTGHLAGVATCSFASSKVGVRQEFLRRARYRP
jgi:hypothetical protein